jgi:YbbR domain-containing protein
MALRDNITRDLGWKLVSLALAVAIWLTINRVSQGPAKPATPLPAMGMRTFTNLPVLLMAAATDGREVSIAPDTVTITLSGPPAKLSAMTGEEIRVIVDLMGIEAARGLRKRVDVSVPPGMAFLSAEPPQVNVTVVPKRE